MTAALLTGSSLLFLLFVMQLHAETIRVTEDLRGGPVQLPLTTPDKEQFVFVSVTAITMEAENIGIVALYDDPVSGRLSDYFKLYDGMGNLLSISWIDGFGIRRTAMDNGLLQEETSGLEGVLVLPLEGDPI